MATRAGAIGNLPWVRGTSQPGVKMAPRGAQHKEAITAELKAEATKIGGKQFIQKYGLASWTAINSIDTQTQEFERYTNDIDEGKEEETTGAELSTEVKEKPPKLPEEPPKGPDIGTELATEAVTQATKKVLEDKKPDISKQTKELVPEKPEFGPLTKTEIQTAKALKGDKPDFYSRAVESIKNAKPDKLTKTKWKSYIESTKDEMDYLGLTEFLQGNESITKKELLKFVEEKNIAPNITVRSIPKDEMNKMYEGYSLGFEKEGTQEHIVFQIGKDNAEVGQLFKSEHFDTEYGTGNFAWARVQVGFGNSDAPPADYEHLASEVFGKFDNTLIIDEIQSDWLQKGQDKGFITDYDIVPGDKLVDYFKKHNITYRYEKKPTEYGYPLEGYRRIEFTQADSIEPGDAPAIGEMDPDITYIFRKSDNTEFTRWQPENYEEDARYSTPEEFLQRAYGIVPDFPVKESKKWVELVLNKMIEKAILDGRDSIAITNGQIQYNRYDAMDEKKRKGLKKFYNTIVYDQLEKISDKYNVELERIDIEDPDQAAFDLEQDQLEFPRKVKTAQNQGYTLQILSGEMLYELVNNRDLPGHASIYSNEGRGQGVDHIMNTLSNEKQLEDNYYIWTKENISEDIDNLNINRDFKNIVWELPIVPVNDAPTNPVVNDILNASSEDRDYIIRQFTIGGAAAYPYEGDNINNIDLIKYTEYLRNYKLPEGVDLGYDKDPEQLIKMKLPKKLQKESYKPIKLSKAKQQTDRLFA